MHDKEKLAQKQSELSKALSAAYLNHQIAELESQVRQLPISQDVQRSDGIKQVAAGNGPAWITGGTGVKEVLGRIDDEFPALEVARRIDDDNRSTRDFEGDDEGRQDDGERDEWRVAVVDVSGLMWAPKAARSLVQRGFEVVIPADGIRTLDLLKKGNSPSAIAARSATRYIEHASRHHQLLSADPSLTVQLGTHYKRGRGLRIQRDEEYRKADELSSLPLMPGEEGPPKWVKSVLGCAAYFAGINKAEIESSFSRDRDEIEPQPVLYVANPPLAVELAQAINGIGPETKEMRDQAESNGIFLERGEGVVVLQEAERFELGLEVLRDEEDEMFDMRRSAGAGLGAGKGRGKGRDMKARPAGSGGHGDRAKTRNGKPKNQEEKQPEVKILLRRQPIAEHTESAGQSQTHNQAGQQTDNDASPSSGPLPLPDAPTQVPMGLLLATNDGVVQGSTSSILPLVKSDSINSQLSADLSPPRKPSKPLPASGGNKSPASKFVPLTRETHPVRRRAGSSDSSDSDHSRPGHGAGRGGRGGRGGGPSRGGGRGGAAVSGGGARSKRGKDKDSEFKNGNFTLLQRPTPPAPPPSVPAPAPVTKEPARVPPVPKVAVRPSAPPVIRGILARPPRGHPHGPAHGVGRPPPLGPPPPFAPDIRGRGRGGGRGGHRGRGGGGHHPLHPGPPAGEKFEFDDAMLRPGYGSPSPFHDMPPPGPPGHQAHRGRPPFGPGHGHIPIWGGHGHGHGGHGPRSGHPHPIDWQPAPERAPVVMLQRPK